MKLYATAVVEQVAPVEVPSSDHFNLGQIGCGYVGLRITAVPHTIESHNPIFRISHCQTDVFRSTLGLQTNQSDAESLTPRIVKAPT